MPRRYRKRRYAIARPVKTTKYSNETFTTRTTLATTNNAAPNTIQIPILPILQNYALLGTRKAKNFTVRIHCLQTIIYGGAQDEQHLNQSVQFALVYVPEGNVPSQLGMGNAQTAVSLYDPNQNVILSGIAGGDNPMSFKTRLARNLNSNDQIYLVVKELALKPDDATSIDTDIVVSVNFAIAF